jgi:hypothetical protein
MNFNVKNIHKFLQKSTKICLKVQKLIKNWIKPKKDLKKVNNLPYAK